MSARYRCMTSSVHICLTVIPDRHFSQDSWSSFFIGTSYKDHQVKLRCVREKLIEWSLEVWIFKFDIKKCYVRRRSTCSSEKKQKNSNSYVFISKITWSSGGYGRFRTKNLLIYVWRSWRVTYSDTWPPVGKFGLYTRKNIFPETSKIRRNSGNPKKLKFSFSEFRKNRFDNFTKSI